jgi:large subunit ribosomal protein L10
MNDFRSKMRAAGGTVKVAKNRLAKIALQGHFGVATYLSAL